MHKTKTGKTYKTATCRRPASSFLLPLARKLPPKLRPQIRTPITARRQLILASQHLLRWCPKHPLFRHHLCPLLPKGHPLPRMVTEPCTAMSYYYQINQPLTKFESGLRPSSFLHPAYISHAACLSCVNMNQSIKK